MYEFLRITHSILRYVVLLGGIAAVIAILQIGRNSRIIPRLKTTSLIYVTAAHLQFVIGLLLYFMSAPWFKMLMDNPKEVMGNKVYRFFAVEHPLMMLIAVVLLTIGRSKIKKAIATGGNFKAARILLILSLLIILAAVPWPFRDLGRGWF